MVTLSTKTLRWLLQFLLYRTLRIVLIHQALYIYRCLCLSIQSQDILWYLTSTLNLMHAWMLEFTLIFFCSLNIFGKYLNRTYANSLPHGFRSNGCKSTRVFAILNDEKMNVVMIDIAEHDVDEPLSSSCRCPIPTWSLWHYAPAIVASILKSTSRYGWLVK